MKIQLDKDKFEMIENAFGNIKKNKNKSANIATIRRCLKSSFSKEIEINIVENKDKNNFFIMSIYPDVSVIDQIVEAIVTEKNDDVIRKIWNGANKWIIEIDSRILDDSIVSVGEKELTALLLHEIGHMVYSNSIPQRISKVMRLEYARASIEVKKLLSDKFFRQLLRLPIIQGCLYDNYKTKSSIKSELKADFFVVKMGYADDLESVLNKLIMLSDTKKIKDIDKSSNDVYSDMKEITLFSLKTIEQFKDRKSSIVKSNLKKLLFSSPSEFVQKSIDEIQKTFFKSSEETSVTESAKMEFFEERANSLIEEMYITEFAGFGTKRLKKIDQSEIDYIQLEKNDIKSNDDKMLLISYIYSKLDIINYYISIIDSGNGKIRVPNSREELINMSRKLEKIKEEILDYRIPDTSYGLFIQYPEGYEG